MQHARMSCAAAAGLGSLLQRGRESRGRQAVGQKAGDTMVARIVHMELVVRDDVLHPALAAGHPMLHHSEASERPDFQSVSRIGNAVRPGKAGQREKEECDASMKLCLSSRRCKSCPAKGEPARAGSKPCAALGNKFGEA
jgi:hypothetical protein